MKNFTAAAILGLALLPVPAESACTLKNLQGRYVAMIAGEFSGFWQRCNVAVDSDGIAGGNCLVGTGDTLPLAVQFLLGLTVLYQASAKTAFSAFPSKCSPTSAALSGGSLPMMG